MSKPRPPAFDLPPPPPGIADPLAPQAGSDWRAPSPMSPSSPQGPSPMAQNPGFLGMPTPNPMHAPVMNPKAMSPIAKLGFFKAMYHFMTDKTASLAGRLFILFVAIYVVSPIDAFPEAFAGPLGLLDDLGLASVAAMYLFSVLGPYRDGTRQLPANNPVPPTTGG